jgi:hypothetical protein
MSTKRAKGCWRGLNPDEQIEAALRDGLSEDRSGIDSNPVHRELAPSSKPRYAAMMITADVCLDRSLRNWRELKTRQTFFLSSFVFFPEKE